MWKRRRLNDNVLGDDNQHSTDKGLEEIGEQQDIHSIVTGNELFLQKIATCKRLQQQLKQLERTKTPIEYTQSVIEQQKKTLCESVEYLNSFCTDITEDMFGECMDLANCIVCRPLPGDDFCSSWKQNVLTTKVFSDGWLMTVGLEETDRWDDMQWSIYQLVYELLLQTLSCHSLRPKIVAKYLTEDFVRNLMELFASPDYRERDYITSVVHHIYKTSVKHRRWIRTYIGGRLHLFVFGDGTGKGMKEMLEFLGAVIRGFVVPLKQEYVDFLFQYLRPLYTCADIESFYGPLAFCILSYIEKDVNLIPFVLQYLYCRWPTCNSAKEVLFLNQLEEILERTPQPILLGMLNKTIHRLGKCICSLHFQVSHRAFLVLENERIWYSFCQLKKQTFGILLEYIQNTRQVHWDKTVLQLAEDWIPILK